MNICRETMKMAVPRAAQALAPRAWQPQGVGSEAYLNGTSQAPTPEDDGKDPISVVAASDSCNIRAKDEEN